MSDAEKLWVADGDLPKWICRDCGYAGFRAKASGTIDFSIVWWCPACGGELFRDDPVGQIEMEAANRV